MSVEVLTVFSDFEVESQMHGVLALALKFAANAKNRTNTIYIAGWLWNLNRKISNLLANVHDIVEGRKPAPRMNPEASKPERVRQNLDTIEHLHRVIDYVYEQARRARLTNNSLTAGSLRSLHLLNSELLDLVSWVETLLDKENNEKLFKRAEQEKAAGDIYDLSQVH